MPLKINNKKSSTHLHSTVCSAPSDAIVRPQLSFDEPRDRRPVPAGYHAVHRPESATLWPYSPRSHSRWRHRDAGTTGSSTRPPCDRWREGHLALFAQSEVTTNKWMIPCQINHFWHVLGRPISDFAQILHVNSHPWEKQLCQILDKSVKYFSSYAPIKNYILPRKSGLTATSHHSLINNFSHNWARNLTDTVLERSQ